MFAFTRIATVLLFVISLGLIVSALPTVAPNANGLVVRHDPSGLTTLVVNLQAEVDVCVKTIAGLTVSADVSAQIDILIGKINTCAAAILALGANIDVDASVQADIAAKVGAVISVIVQLGLSLKAKFGTLVMLGLFAKIDVCLQLLLTNLGVCVNGITSLVVKAVANIGVNVFANIHLGLCAQVLGLISI
ncbi:unnamed protein product [Rhizoctonia solani]|uniref:Transmembrane protein n=1 Tax=Rhizoctonia solani TaxID=456999 RepID=A0A8H2W9T6_9AGAM|nr:unnamed protein product [Rhizoctonia solani]